MNTVTSFFKSLTGGKKVLLLISPILTVLLSLKVALAGLAIVITIDLITGIRKHFHNEGVSTNPCKKVFWTTLKSEGLRRTWRKSTEYGFGIVILAVVEASFIGAPIITLMDNTFTLTELGVLIATLIESHSIYENLYAVNPRSKLLRLIAQLIPIAKKYLMGKLEGVFKSKNSQ